MSSLVINRSHKHLNHPPGPHGHWLFGTSRDFQSDILGTMIEMNATYGDAIRMRFIPGFWGYIFAHPEHNKHILQDNNQNYTKMPHPSIQLLRPAVGNGLLTNDGDSWKRQRRLAQPAFHRRRIAEFGTMMTEATQAMLKRWHVAGSTIDLDVEMTRLTLEIVGKALFSIDLTREAETIGDAFSVVNHEIAKLSATPFSNFIIKMPWARSTRRINQNMTHLHLVVDQIIQERHLHPRRADQADLLDMLMMARDEETGQGMNDQQLHDEVMTLMLAGHETTAHTMGWTFYLLQKHPEVRAKLEAELERVLNGRLPTMADIPNLPYTRMVLDESLRLYPVAYAMTRWGNDADVVGGYDVQPKAVITLLPYLTHRHPDFWSEPEKFDPERFTPERQKARPRYAYIPFGGGPRQCIGNMFAITEAMLILATVTQQYRLDLAPGAIVEPEPLITLRPKHGLPMTLSPQ